MSDLNTAQRTLDEKEAELAEVQAEFDKAMAGKQVCYISSVLLYIFFHQRYYVALH